jgi:hypothetical protein
MRVIRKVYSQKSPIRRGEVELFEFLGQTHACDRNLESACSDCQSIGAGNQECPADDDAAVDGARLVFSEVRTALNRLQVRTRLRSQN